MNTFDSVSRIVAGLLSVKLLLYILLAKMRPLGKQTA